MLIEDISVVIIAKNAEKTLQSCLDSLKDFKEVVLYENNSIDNTIKVAQKYSNVKIVQGNFLGFGKTKNEAAKHSLNSWILSLDSDEVLSKEFIDNLKNIQLDDNRVYEIHRKNFYKDKEIKHCWGDEYIIRLYNKDVTSFTNSDVHEKIIKKNLSITKLKGSVKHYPYLTIEEFINKANHYSTLFAKNNVGKKSSSPLKAFFNGVYSFIKTYFFKQGFRDGYVGLIIAYSHMVTNFYKYIKLYELNLEQKYKRDKK